MCRHRFGVALNPGPCFSAFGCGRRGDAEGVAEKRAEPFHRFEPWSVFILLVNPFCRQRIGEEAGLGKVLLHLGEAEVMKAVWRYDRAYLAKLLEVRKPFRGEFARRTAMTNLPSLILVTKLLDVDPSGAKTYS